MDFLDHPSGRAASTTPCDGKPKIFPCSKLPLRPSRSFRATCPLAAPFRGPGPLPGRLLRRSNLHELLVHNLFLFDRSDVSVRINPPSPSLHLPTHDGNRCFGNTTPFRPLTSTASSSPVHLAPHNSPPRWMPHIFRRTQRHHSHRHQISNRRSFLPHQIQSSLHAHCSDLYSPATGPLPVRPLYCIRADQGMPRLCCKIRLRRIQLMSLPPRASPTPDSATGSRSIASMSPNLQLFIRHKISIRAHADIPHVKAPAGIGEW